MWVSPTNILMNLIEGDRIVVNERYDSTNKLKLLWKLTRPHTLTASFVPVLIGTVLSMFFVQVDVWLFLAMLFATLMIQIGTNLFNEYYDFKRGLDTEESVGIGGAIVRHGMKPKRVMDMALASYGFALLLGVYICMNSSWWLALVGVMGMLIGYLYTGGPYPIAYTPFGELFAGLFMGSFFILIAFFIQTGYVNMEAILISIPMAFLVGGINLSNNIRDIDEDIKGGRKTLAIMAGKKRAVYILGTTFFAAYALIIGLVTTKIFSPWILIVFLSIFKPIQAIKGFQEEKTTGIAMKATALTNTIFGLLISVGLLIYYFLR